MIQEIYYGGLLTILTGIIVWAIRSFVGKALENMATQIQYVKDGVRDVKDNVKEVKDNVRTNLTSVRTDLNNSTIELKKHFDKTCGERQASCSRGVDARIHRLESHGHVGLKGDEAKITTS